MTPVDLAWPFTGAWLVQMSPANRVPSHGTTLFATSYAIDFVPVDDWGRSLPPGTGGWAGLPADRYAGFGRPVRAPVEGVVVSVADCMPDHDSPRGLALARYALTQRSRLREGGWRGLAGNHVVIRAGEAYVALCHLKEGSVRAMPGLSVKAGDPVGACGNSGNSTEPHLHLQAMDGPDPTVARALPICFEGGLPHNGAIVGQ